MKSARVEQIIVSSWLPIARRRKRNITAIVIDQTGRKYFFKKNTGGWLAFLTSQKETRRRDICNILTSHILVNEFKLYGVVYRDCVLVFTNGECLFGIVCDYLEKIKILESTERSQIRNVAEVTWNTVLLTWLGDLDRSSWNQFVTTEGMFGAIDFDFAFSNGITLFRTPIGNRYAIANLLIKEETERIKRRIAGLSEQCIYNAIGAIGRKFVVDWTNDYHREFYNILIYNRSQLLKLPSSRLFTQERYTPIALWETFVAYNRPQFFLVRKLIMLLRRQGFISTLKVLGRNVIALR